jgi:carbon starvation protein CstA
VDRRRIGFCVPRRLPLLQPVHRAEGDEDPTRSTPAVINNDGLNYVPTNRYVLFGHHFAAIAGAGPLVGPVLAAQMGYLPGTLWLLAGVVLAGAVQDFMVLFISSRRNGASLGEMIKQEMGPVPGSIALFGCFLIMIIILAVLALIVVKALAESPWGVFTVCSTVPIALFMGIYMRFLRPGRVGEVSVIGIVLLVASIWFGGVIAHDPYWGPALTFKDTTITFTLIGYAFISALLPVWLILAPRDYLATFLKIGVIVGLALGIVILNPDLKMPAVTQYIDGTGPLWKGAVPVPVYHHRLRRGLRLPRADRLRHHAEAAGQRNRCPLYWLRRDADGILVASWRWLRPRLSNRVSTSR